MHGSESEGDSVMEGVNPDVSCAVLKALSLADEMNASQAEADQVCNGVLQELHRVATNLEEG